ncbi:pilus assembly protein PilO [Yersinia sp. 2544 StPb PI]|uniref:pilus assembly protein PilO n=1 Tax=unclassified Yersinia (in: enterobacteria) TaxID=2653513 RepID=UPI003B28B9CE
MNKRLQHWMDRPGWQILIGQWVFLGLLSVMAYGMLLRPAWQQQRLTADKIIQHQQQVDHHQAALAPLPSLSLVRQQMMVLKEREASWLSLDSSMAHLTDELIAPFGGQVIRWQRQSGPVGEAAVDSIRHQQWHATLRVNFYGLLHLFRQLAEIPTPVQTQLVEINSDNSVLSVKLSLKEYLAGGVNE